MTGNSDVLVVGDGPAGLSAALFLAKNGMSVAVVGQDQSGARKALLHNDLGIREVTGPEFLRTAREQCERYGARLHRGVATSAARSGEGFVVTTEDGGRFEARDLVLATGWAHDLADELGLEKSEDGVRIDLNGRTNVEGVHAGGALARGVKSQVATSVGDGAAIAIDILSRVKGKPFHDWEVHASPQRRQQTA